MIRSRQAALGLVAAGVLALTILAIGLGACAKRITSVDSSYVSPEGRRDSTELIVWFEAPTETLIYLDRAPIGASFDNACGFTVPGPEDSLINRGLAWRYPQGTVVGVILDQTPATQYEVLRREAGGGFRQLQDFPAQPIRRWTPAQFEEYMFVDPIPSGFSPPTYLGRGMVEGTVTKNSPLTNLGIAPRPGPTDTIPNLNYTGFCNPCDSLFTLRWDPVPGAVRYWMQVYQYAVAPTPQEMLRESVPGPILNPKAHDILVAFVDAPSTSYKIGSVRPDVTVLVQRAMNYISPYFVRVTAVSAEGRLLAFTRGNYSRIPGEGRYTLFRMGGVVVDPKVPGTTTPPCRRETAVGP